MEPTSEQELKQLLEEGKITEQEYQELLEAIRQKETVQKPLDVPQKPTEPKPRTGYGKAALILMIIGLLSPLVPLIYHLIMNMRAANESPRFVMLFCWHSSSASSAGKHLRARSPRLVCRVWGF
jgi:hypothetical protein